MTEEIKINSKTTAKDFFLYLGIIIGLCVSSTSFLILIFQIVGKLFPLPAEYIGDIDYVIQGCIAALIISFPTFIYLLFLANKDLQVNPEKKDMWVKRWMIFLTLFITGLTMAIDLITLVYRLLGAEDLTLRFFLKVFFVFAVAITIFKFTLKDLKRTSFEITNWIKVSAGIISIIILSVIIYGIIIIGSPNFRRAKMMDEIRINDLANIQDQIVNTQWQNKGAVPVNLDALKDPISNYVLPVDPETKQNYEYKMLSKNSFELCATFKAVNEASTSRMNPDLPLEHGYGSTNENWKHGIGRTCFTRTIDEKLHPLELPVKIKVNEKL